MRRRPERLPAPGHRRTLELWILITVLAAFLQNLRSMLQKRAADSLSVNGASYTRFLFALPFVLVYVTALGTRGALPAPALDSILYAALGGGAQIVGTSCLIASFAGGRFAVGTAFSKTEAAQTAVFGLLLLGERLSTLALAGLSVSFIGVLILSGADRSAARPTSLRTVAFGVLSGAGFAVSAVCYRAAALALPEGDFLARSGVTLALAVSLQTLMLGSWLALREPGEMARVLASWRNSVLVGVAGASASAAWFAAMTLTNAALVRALGQIELLFTFAASALIFRERIRGRELAGALLIVAGIWLLIA